MKNNNNEQDITTDNSPEKIFRNIPFEEMGHYGIMKGFWQTLRLLITSPGTFYRTMHVNKGYQKPFIFAVIMITLNILVSNIYMSTGLLPSPQQQISRMMEMSSDEEARNSAERIFGIPDLRYQVTSRDSNEIKVSYQPAPFIKTMKIDSTNMHTIAITLEVDTTALQLSFSSLYLSSESLIKIQPAQTNEHIRYFRSASKITVNKTKEAIPYRFSIPFMINNIFISLAVFLLLIIIWHMGLVLIGASRNGFQATFRIMAYSTVLALFRIIPLSNATFSFIIYSWWMILVYKGITEAHEQRRDKALLGTIIPFTLAMITLMLFMLL